VGGASLAPGNGQLVRLRFASIPLVSIIGSLSLHLENRLAEEKTNCADRM